MFDIAVIGAGVIGCAIARELTKYDLKICVLEKNSDIATGTSKANSGIVHAGEDPMPGTMKAKMNIRGNQMFDVLQKELGFPFKRNGSMVLCFEEKDREKLEELRQRGLKNGIADTMEIIDRQEALKREPNLSEKVIAALVLPTGGVVCPYEMTIALAENAYENGAIFLLGTKVKEIIKTGQGFRLVSEAEQIESRIVINTAGVHADEINNELSQRKHKITPRKGEYMLFDKSVGSLVTHTLFQLPTQMGKGILVTPTVSGNLLIGPTALDIEDKLDVETSKKSLEEAVDKARLSIQQIPMNQLITSFSGLRAHVEEGDFIIEEAKDVDNFFNVLGIESPGLTSAPAIAEYVREWVVDRLKAGENTIFNPIRKPISKFATATEEERKRLITMDKRYGKIVCRCEEVTEAEIIRAIRGPLGARTIDGIKRRTRAGMGRCQSGFCMNRIMEILAEELQIPIEQVTKFGVDSQILIGNIKAYLEEEGSK